MSLLAFQCRYGGADLCFMGSSCAVEVNGTRVKTEEVTALCMPCPAGYGPDNSLMHFPNCAKPDGVYAAYLGTQTVLALVYLPEFARMAYRAKGSLRVVCLQNVATIACFWVAWLGVLLQDGFFEVACAFVPLALFSSLLAWTSLSQVTLSPVLQFHFNTTLIRWQQLVLRLINVAAGVFMFGLTVLLIVEARASPGVFNVVMLWLGGVSMGALVVMLLVLLGGSTLLLLELRSVEQAKTGLVATHVAASPALSALPSPSSTPPAATAAAGFPPSPASDMRLGGSEGDAEPGGGGGGGGGDGDGSGPMQSSAEGMRHFQRRLEAYRVVLVLIVVFFFAPLVCSVPVLIVLGSMPFQWVTVFGLLLAFDLSVVGMARFSRTRTQTRNRRRTLRMSTPWPLRKPSAASRPLALFSSAPDAPRRSDAAKSRTGGGEL